MSAHGEVIGPPSQGRRAKDLGFRLALLACLGASILMLGVLLEDVVADGIGHLSWDFITSFTSISAARIPESWGKGSA